MLKFKYKHSTENKKVFYHYNFDEWEDVSRLSYTYDALFAYEDHQSVGQMVLQLLADETVVLFFFVKPEYQRKGIGTALIKELERRNYSDVIHLAVRNKDKGLVSFYEKNGFKIDLKETNKRNKALKEDNLWMTKKN